MLLEVFTETYNESKALEQTWNIITDSKVILKQKLRGILGDKGTTIVKKNYKEIIEFIQNKEQNL